jgi:hypothetical protein
MRPWVIRGIRGQHSQPYLRPGGIDRNFLAEGIWGSQVLGWSRGSPWEVLPLRPDLPESVGTKALKSIGRIS